MNASASFTSFSGMLIPILSDSAVKGSVILLLATVAVLMLRHLSAATRHLVWLLAFVVLLVLPMLSAVLPKWPVLPQWKSAQATGYVASAGKMQNFPRAEGDAASQNPPLAGLRGPVGSADVTSTPNGASKSNDILALAAVKSWRRWVTLVWAAGATVLLIRLLASHLLLRRAANRCGTIPANDELFRGVLVHASSQLGITRMIVLLLDEHRTIPLVWGVFRPRLILPAEALRNPEQLQSVLLHELAHICRCDPLVQWLVQIVCAMQWFNPLVWFAARRLNAEAERACDDVVLSGGVQASAYAEHLLQVASSLSPARWASSCSLAMARRSSLEGRLLAVLDAKLNRRALTRSQALATGMLAMAIALPIAMLHAANDKVPTAGELPLQQQETFSLESIKTTADSAELYVRQEQGAIAMVAGEGPSERVVVHEFSNSGGPVVFKVSADDRQGRWWDQMRIIRDTEGESLFPELPDQWLPRGTIVFLAAPVKRADGSLVFAEIESATGKTSPAA